MSDKEKGILQVVEDVLSWTAHAFCIKHMEANLEQTFNDAILLNDLRTTTTSYILCEYDAALEMMKAHNTNIERCLSDKLAKTLSNTRFIAKKYVWHTTTSIFKSGNTVLKGAMGMLITAFVEHTHQRMTAWYENHLTNG